MDQKHYYNRLSPFFGLYMKIGSLGAIPELYRTVARALDASEGDTLLDLGCGRGDLTEFLREEVGGRGRVVGVDLSDRMIARAKHRAERNEWNNVTYSCADLNHYRPEKPVDGAVFCLSLSLLRPWEEVLSRTVSFLRPGKTLVIADALVTRHRRFSFAANAYTRVKASIIGSQANARIAEVASEFLEQVEVRVVHGGLYSIIRGTVPAEERRVESRSSRSLHSGM